MTRNRKKGQERVYKSMMEFKKQFFPKSSERRNSETDRDPTRSDIISSEQLLNEGKPRPGNN